MEKLRTHIQHIAPINDEEFEEIKTHFTLKKVRKGQYLLSEGDEVKHEYFVLSGIYKVFYIDGQEKEYILQFAQENWWMSDYPSFFKQKDATMYIECLVEGEVLCLTLQNREKLSATFHKMEHFFRVKLTNGYVALQLRIKLLLSGTPQQRYEEFARLYPNLMQQIPKKLIAEFLGVSRETLSRLYQ
ncbi:MULTISPECIES: Crp/Fnr family transcriptional regulator [unclassified Arcicella]|uniref:Crp/Fnr family transcriptional regulator n=1 Tax=unclassified Arcicella TaxID=2644986 RepID=UPI00285DAB75|nr:MULTISPECIES: Crp/Fnr family transcriptional regulator [unclassified Arcicella]MDR6562236.1 CRP-like cAMP-binding protein [Arcicella sp. BE51]MDR6812070.1 CRP-like cAMP-binding protein [Arcicella sp. BE140]MDR6823381.1 CRP-like cAMP-binding protein [Arcicella sp. BE139]